jgi:hypothetical protein
MMAHRNATSDRPPGDPYPDCQVLKTQLDFAILDLFRFCGDCRQAPRFKTLPASKLCSASGPKPMEERWTHRQQLLCTPRWY